MFSKIQGPLGIAEAGRFLEQQAGMASQGAGAGTVLQGGGTEHCSLSGSVGMNCQPCGRCHPFWDHWILAGVERHVERKLGVFLLRVTSFRLLFARKNAVETYSSAFAMPEPQRGLWGSFCSSHGVAPCPAPRSW